MRVSKGFWHNLEAECFQPSISKRKDLQWTWWLLFFAPDIVYGLNCCKIPILLLRCWNVPTDALGKHYRSEYSYLMCRGTSWLLWTCNISFFFLFLNSVRALTREGTEVDMYLTCFCLVPSAFLLKFSPSIFIFSTCSWPLPSTRLTAYAGRAKQKGAFKMTRGLFCLSALIKVQTGWRLQGCSVSSDRINMLMDPVKGEEIEKIWYSHWTVLDSFW